MTTRRRFIQNTALSAVGASVLSQNTFAQPPGERPAQTEDITVINPRARVPLSFIIDDSTCLVNLAHFGIPHFHAALPQRYPQDWRSLPREIPDSFVRKFAHWCNDHGVKGKYSVVPYPACVGWVDRDMPGWSVQELKDSLDLIRNDILPDWDIHPEMISHTWVIDTKTGRPYPEQTEHYMENFRWTDGKSVDQLADYLAYALKILHNVGLPCEGITTPGGFASRVLPELSKATLQACRDVYQTEIPHYFRHLFTDERSVAPRVENAANLRGDDPECVVSIIGCTGDWFGGWDGLTPGDVDKFITADLSSGRMVEVIERGEPAIMVCHWPGIYYNGAELGFNIFKEAVRRMHSKYDHLIWMKLSEISRYWAAKELTEITSAEQGFDLYAPFACPGFTLQLNKRLEAQPLINHQGNDTPLKEVNSKAKLQAGTFWRGEGQSILCFDLPQKSSVLKTA